jgi:hypothetical protein
LVAWLQGRDILSGQIRQQLLDDAVARGDAGRVISFFRGFLQKAAAAPRHGMGAQIAEMARLRRKGAYSDAQWAAWEAEIVAAGREGRVIGALDADGLPITR